MNDEQLIWEIYMKSHEGDTGETPWNPQTLILNSGVTLSDIPEDKLFKYLRLISERIQNHILHHRKKYGRVDYDEFQAWAKPDGRTYTMKRLNKLFKGLGFEFDEINDLKKLNPYKKDGREYDEWYDDIHEMYVVLLMWAKELILYDMPRSADKQQ